MATIGKIQNLLQIQSENSEIRRKGRRILFLIALLLLIGVAHFLLELPDKLEGGMTAGEIVSISVQVMSGLIIALIYVYLVWTANQFARESEEKTRFIRRHLSQTEARLEETQKLYDFSNLLATTLDAGEIYQRTARTFTAYLQVSSSTVFAWENLADSVVHQVTCSCQSETETCALEVQDLPRAEFIVADRIFQERQPELYSLNDPDLASPARRMLAEMGQFGCLDIPLVRGDKLLGLIRLCRQNEADPLFSSEEIRLAQTMANETAVALANAQLTAEAQARVAQLSSLYRFSLFLSEAPGLTDIFKGARREILSFVEATGMSISLLVPDGAKLHWIYGYELGQEVDLSAIPPLPISEGFAGYVARNREMLYINRATEDVEKYHSVTVGAEVKVWLGLPMIVANRLVGVLAIENETDFSEREISLLKTIVGPLAIAIQNARLLGQAEARAQRQLNLNRISTQLHQTADVENIVGLGLRALSDVVEGDAVSLHLGRPYPAATAQTPESDQD